MSSSVKLEKLCHIFTTRIVPTIGDDETYVNSWIGFLCSAVSKSRVCG